MSTLAVRSSAHRIAALLLAMLPLAGCGGGPTSAVKLRASSDFLCPNNKIDVSGGGECTYQAVGCGKKATYLVEPREEGASGCCPSPGCRAHRQGTVTAE